jgi:hypothetical protein
MKKAPAFGAIKGAGMSSLRARDAGDGSGGRGNGRGGKRLLNRGMTRGNNGNYIGKRDEGETSAPADVKEDDHQHEAELGYPLYSDGPERLGWLVNFNAVSRRGGAAFPIWLISSFFLLGDYYAKK